MYSYTTRSMIQLRSQQQEVFSLMRQHSKMLTVAPTSAGKSIMMIADAKHRFTEGESKTIVVVAPKLLLAQQLSDEFEKFITNANFAHVHSGDTKYFRTTDFLELAYWSEKTDGNKLIFSTYHSLDKIVKAELDIDTVYLDECHNAVNKRFFASVEALSKTAVNFYSMTATPKFSQVASKPGNNDAEVFGSKIHNVKAPELLKNGSILPPVTSVIEVAGARSKENAAESDFFTLCDTILNEDDMNKVLVVAPNTKVMMNMLSKTSFMEEMNDNGYDVLHITSKLGAFINQRKVSRSEFLDILAQYGADANRKFVVLHIGILTEGISVPGIQSCIFLRQQNFISTIQSIGRCIRVHPEDTARMQSGELNPGDFPNYLKPFGKVVIPVYNNKVGIATARRVQNVVDEVFVKGNFVADVIKK
jgi:superfamily II DNA or RNA helicase